MTLSTNRQRKKKKSKFCNSGFSSAGVGPFSHPNSARKGGGEDSRKKYKGGGLRWKTPLLVKEGVMKKKGGPL